ncbi:MAG: DNA polymerase III subunit delta [marine bacterium B5-7]|nr:MAG: DNA polymerase III subunit delta [marine bacterium B5-7]
MQIAANGLAAALERSSNARCFLLHGAEPLLVEESKDLIRAHFSERGYTDINRLSVETGFDWDALSVSSRSLSLFSDRRAIELRLPTGRPGDKGAAFLRTYAEESADDSILVVIAGKLDKKILSAMWCKVFADHGLVVDCGSIPPLRLPGWIEQRFVAQGVTCQAGVSERLAYYVEGNLLAADQEVRKITLTLPQGTELDISRLEASLADHARFNVFAFIDACVAGQAARSLRILNSLRREGVEPVMMVWALVRETRNLLLIAGDIKSGVPRQEAFSRHRVWSSRAPMVMAALKRLGINRLTATHRRAARLERIAKGHARDYQRGTDASVFWFEFEQVALALCGVKSLPSFPGHSAS